MSLATPLCPSCRQPLVLTHRGELDSWVCPSGHGLALTVTESYTRLQEDEIAQLWKAARDATPTNDARISPICERPMVSVELTFDDDEVPEGEPGDGANRGSVWLEVSVEDQLIWFDDTELAALPEDLPDAAPSAAELEGVEAIREAFGQSIVEVAHARDAATITERIYRRIARNPGLTKVLTEVGSLGRR